MKSYIYLSLFLIVLIVVWFFWWTSSLENTASLEQDQSTETVLERQQSNNE